MYKKIIIFWIFYINQDYKSEETNKLENSIEEISEKENSEKKSKKASEKKVIISPKNKEKIFLLIFSNVRSLLSKKME